VKLSYLHHIVAVAERGSLRAAARHLGIAQPAITRSIRELERELGVTLCERRPKGVVLTPMGELFLKRAVTVLGELRRAREDIDQARGMTTGRVSIALSTAAQLALLPGALAGFRRRFPDVFLSIQEGLFPAIEAHLKSGELDFYVGPLPEQAPTKDLIVEKLFDNTRVVLARRGHPLAKAASLRDLVGARWIGTSVTQDSAAELGPVFQALGLPNPVIEMTLPSGPATTQAVVNSDLLVMVPEQWLAVSLASENLTTLPILEPLPAPPICLVRRVQMPLTPAAQYFADLIHRAGLHYVRERSGHAAKPAAPPDDLATPRETPPPRA
jgi:LysR family transcriptional regulator, regulator of abg operon